MKNLLWRIFHKKEIEDFKNRVVADATIQDRFGTSAKIKSVGRDGCVIEHGQTIFGPSVGHAEFHYLARHYKITGMPSDEIERVLV